MVGCVLLRSRIPSYRTLFERAGDSILILEAEGDEVGRIVDAKFKTFGCGAAIAVSSMVTEMVKGKTLDEALAISKETVANELGGLPPQKMHCSNLGADALKKAIEDYRSKHPNG